MDRNYASAHDRDASFRGRSSELLYNGKIFQIPEPKCQFMKKSTTSRFFLAYRKISEKNVGTCYSYRVAEISKTKGGCGISTLGAKKKFEDSRENRMQSRTLHLQEDAGDHDEGAVHDCCSTVCAYRCKLLMQMHTHAVFGAGRSEKQQQRIGP